ncbi:multicopper oxidase CueO [Roseibium marinum]|nr:multicopper oxidase CueO [Roseibium marinum]
MPSVLFRPNINRRAFLAGTAGTLVLPGLLTGMARAATERPSLPIPQQLFPDSKGNISLRTVAGEMSFIDGMKTPTYGINGPYLGPAIRVRRGDTVAMNVRNELDEPITMHWHGLKIPGKDDGGPAEAIAPGASWEPRLNIDQPAATCWFHPHYYPTTAEQVIKGLAGLFLIDDDEADALGLPSEWGVDDIPIILQDRRFNKDGSFFHRFNMAAITVGYVGDTMLVNGAVYPQARTAKGWLRLRILNGSNARSYKLALSGGKSFFVVGSDGGLLSEPVELKDLMVNAGERYELLVDARDGNTFDLMTLPVDQMAMNLPPFDKALAVMTFRPEDKDGKGRLPDALVTLPPLANLPADAKTQKLVFGMNMDKEGMGIFMKAGLPKLMENGEVNAEIAAAVTRLLVDGPKLPEDVQLSANTINGKSFALDKVNFDVAMNQEQRWVFSEGTDAMEHPVHVHGCQYRIVSVNGKAPPAYMAGWKDTASISKGGTVEIQVRFDYPATRDRPYMAHCHILEHEDSGMMAAFTVS